MQLHAREDCCSRSLTRSVRMRSTVIGEFEQITSVRHCSLVLRKELLTSLNSCVDFDAPVVI
jgi:hypothetical protein